MMTLNSTIKIFIQKVLLFNVLMTKVDCVNEAKINYEKETMHTDIIFSLFYRLNFSHILITLNLFC